MEVLQYSNLSNEKRSFIERKMTYTYLTYTNMEFPLPIKEGDYNYFDMKESEEIESELTEEFQGESNEDPLDNLTIIYRDEEIIEKEKFAQEYEKSEKEFMDYYSEMEAQMKKENFIAQNEEMKKRSWTSIFGWIKKFK